MNINEINDKLEAAVNDTRANGTRHDVVGVVSNVAVLKAYAKAPFKDAEFTGAVLTGGEWRKTSHYHATWEEAFLHTMGVSREGANSQFGKYAAMMLNGVSKNQCGVTKNQ